MNISHQFDSGSIEVFEIIDPLNIRLKLKRDNQSTCQQWFHFRLQTTQGVLHRLAIINAGESLFPKAWNGYQVVASYDRINWFRVETCFDGRELIIQHKPEKKIIYYAYFQPYDYARHQRLLSSANQSKLFSHHIIGNTNDNNPIDLLTFGREGGGKQKIWLIARQHPGETMAEWFIEGVISRLLQNDVLVNQLLKSCVFYIVPNMNPDGSIRGNHRSNSKGLNLNREWNNPSKTDCPEVFYVRQMMHDKGVDMFLDIHGEEEIPYNFIMGSYTHSHLVEQARLFKNDFAKANSEFQQKIDYTSFHGGTESCCGAGCGKQTLDKASHYVESKFKCLSLVLEMPFIDNLNNPDSNTGWSAERSMLLGKTILEPIYRWQVREN